MNQVESGPESDTRPGTETDLAQPVVVAAADQQTDSREDVADNTSFFPVSENKLFTLYLLSFGLYGIYWFYRNWKLQQPVMDKKIYPLWRAIFSIFFTHALFRRINRRAARLEGNHRFKANTLATFYVVAILASHMIDRVDVNLQMPANIVNAGIIAVSLVLFILSVFPLVKVQATVNRINHDLPGYLNCKYSLFNYLLIAAGAFLWFMIALGLLLEIMGIAMPAQAIRAR